MAIFARTNRFSVIYNILSSSEKFDIHPKHFHLVQFSPYMSDLNLFEILYSDFENKGYLRCEPFLNPMLSISDLEDPVTSEQKRLFNKCREAIVDQTHFTELYKHICRTPEPQRNRCTGYSSKKQPKKAVKCLVLDC